MFPRVVTGEEISPTAAHAGLKRRPKWLPGVWGMAGPPCPGVINEVDRPFRLGDGERRTTCHRKKAVRKPKLWPRHSQTEWNRPRQWKMIEMRIATWNVCTLYKAGVMN